MRKKPSQERSIKMVEKLLAEAATMIEEGGIEALNTNTLAERAGVSVGSLYQYFSDREELICALAEEYFENMRVLFSSIFSAYTVRENLETLLDMMLDRGLALNTRNPGLKNFILSQEAPPLLRESLEASNRAIQAILVSFIELKTSGKVKGAEAELIFQVTMSMFKALVSALSAEGADRPRLISEYRGLILDYWVKRIMEPRPIW